MSGWGYDLPPGTPGPSRYMARVTCGYCGEERLAEVEEDLGGLTIIKHAACHECGQTDSQEVGDAEDDEPQFDTRQERDDHYGEDSPGGRYYNDPPF